MIINDNLYWKHNWCVLLSTYFIQDTYCDTSEGQPPKYNVAGTLSKNAAKRTRQHARIVFHQKSLGKIAFWFDFV